MQVINYQHLLSSCSSLRYNKYETIPAPKTPVIPTVFHVTGLSFPNMVFLRLGNSTGLFNSPDTLLKLNFEI